MKSPEEIHIALSTHIGSAWTVPDVLAKWHTETAAPEHHYYFNQGTFLLIEKVFLN